MTLSDRLKLYLNQTIQYQAAQTYDKFGHAVPSAISEIPARIEHHSKQVNDVNGKTVVANSTVWTLQQISPDDKVNGRKVINSFAMVDKLGNTIGWESYLC